MSYQFGWAEQVLDLASFVPGYQLFRRASAPNRCTIYVQRTRGNGPFVGIIELNTEHGQTTLRLAPFSRDEPPDDAAAFGEFRGALLSRLQAHQLI